MRKLLTKFVVAFALVCTAHAASSSSPNFLFVFVDDQGWSGTSVAMMPGKEFSRTASFRMPNLDRLAAQGMVFSQAYAGHPKCECSRASLLMGRTTTSLNAVNKQSRNWNAPATDSLANTLKRANANYRAAHFGKWQWPTPPDKFGYDASDGVTQNEDGDSRDPNDPKQTFGITRRAQTFMEKQVKDGHPFYLQLSYYAVHPQPQALASTLKKYEGAGGGGSDGSATFGVRHPTAMATIERSFTYIPLNAAHGPHVVPEEYYRDYVGKPGVNLETAKFFGMLNRTASRKQIPISKVVNRA